MLTRGVTQVATGCEDSRAECTGWVDGAPRDWKQDTVRTEYSHPNGEASGVSGTLLVSVMYRGVEDDEEEKEREEEFPTESVALGEPGSNPVRSEAPCGVLTFWDGCGKKTGSSEGTKELEKNDNNSFQDFALASYHQRGSNCGVDVAAGLGADGVGKDNNPHTEGESDLKEGACWGHCCADSNVYEQKHREKLSNAL